MSSISFWQQDQNYFASQQNWTSQLSSADALGSTLISALTNQSSTSASLANQIALNRVNGQIAAAEKSASGNSSSSSGSSASNGSTASTAPPVASPFAQTTPAGYAAGSSAVNLQSDSTAASLLLGELPAGSLLSIIA